MPRPKHIDRPVKWQMCVPKSIYDKMMSELYSEIEGRVPYGAATNLVTELVTKWLEERGIAV